MKTKMKMKSFLTTLICLFFVGVLLAWNNLNSPYDGTINGKEILTPPMGWNSWYVQSEGVSEQAIHDMAAAIEEKGLDQYGWTYININDCWMGSRHPQTKAIQANSKFGDMKAMANFANSKGFKLGIYSTAWMSTFAGYIGGTAPNAEGDYSEFFLPENEIINPSQYFGRHPSSTQRGIAQVGPYWFIDRDAKQFAEWGIDYVKYDWVETKLVKDENGKYSRPGTNELRKTDSFHYSRKARENTRSVETNRYWKTKE